MLGFRQGAAVPAGAPLSLRRSFAATLAGNGVFAACQAAALIMIARLGSAEMLGQYALAAAIATPVALFSHLNLRAVLATDMGQRHAFGEYLSVRWWTTAAGVLVIAGVAVAGRHTASVTGTILGVGVVLSADNLSDIYYGALQRRDRMDSIAGSTAARGLLSAAALGTTLWLTHNLLAAVGAQAAARIAVLLAYDRPAGSAGESLAASGWRNQFEILWAALPLGVVLMLSSLAVNLPRYAIGQRLGLAALGAFAAPASFLTVGTTVVNALGQAATPKLARSFSEGNAHRFKRLALNLAGVSALLGAAGIAAGLTIGRLALRLLYGSAYADSVGLLIWLMAAGLVGYIAFALGYVITSARAFAAQAPLFAVVAAVAAAGSWALVPMAGLRGAALALALAWTTQICGSLLILRGALRKWRKSVS